MITGELQHNLVVVDVDKKQENKTKWRSEGKKHNVSKLRDDPADSFSNGELKKLCLTTIMIYRDYLNKVC